MARKTATGAALTRLNCFAKFAQTQKNHSVKATRFIWVMSSTKRVPRCDSAKTMSRTKPFAGGTSDRANGKQGIRCSIPSEDRENRKLLIVTTAVCAAWSW